MVPPIWPLELANALVVAERRNIATAARSDRFLELVASARRHALSSYDASYLDLALREGLPLATLESGGSKSGADRLGSLRGK